MKIAMFAHFKEYHWVYGFGGRCLKIRDVCMDFEAYFKVHSLVSVHPKSIILGQMTHLSIIFHVVVSVYWFVKIWNSPQFPAEFQNGQLLTHTTESEHTQKKIFTSLISSLDARPRTTLPVTIKVYQRAILPRWVNSSVNAIIIEVNLLSQRSSWKDSGTNTNVSYLVYSEGWKQNFVRYNWLMMV